MKAVTRALPANRVAALTTFIAGLAGCGTSLAHVWPSGVTNEIALIAGSVATMAGPLAHIVGSWIWDRTPAGQALGWRSADRHPIPELPTSTQASGTPELDVINEPYPEDFAEMPNPRAGGPELDEQIDELLPNGETAT